MQVKQRFSNFKKKLQHVVCHEVLSRSALEARHAIRSVKTDLV